MPDKADKSAAGRRLARLEMAQLRAIYFANGGVIKRYPAWLHGPDHRYVMSGWGRSQLKRRGWETRKKQEKK